MIEQTVLTESHGATDVADIALCKKIYEVLTKHYPGHPWCVGANSESGAADIKLLYHDPRRPRTNYGYSLNLGSLDDERGMRKVMTAGGELLERYGLARGPAKPESGLIALHNGMDITR